jgi:hypothetical protein
VFSNAGITTDEKVEMPPPGSQAPATFSLSVRDSFWELLYLPLEGAIDVIASLLNHLQFLTIRQYLSFVFLSLVFLLLVLATWA